MCTTAFFSHLMILHIWLMEIYTVSSAQVLHIWRDGVYLMSTLKYGNNPYSGAIVKQMLLKIQIQWLGRVAVWLNCFSCNCFAFDTLSLYFFPFCDGCTIITLAVKVFFPFVLLMGRGLAPAVTLTLVFSAQQCILFPPPPIMNYPFTMQEHLIQAYEN